MLNMAAVNRATNLQGNHMMSDLDFLTEIMARGKSQSKWWFGNYHDRIHSPALRALSEGPIKCLLLGHSGLERFRSLGKHTVFGMEDSHTVFNLGVGGDTIGNVLYRLGRKVGSKGLYQKLKDRGVRCTIVDLGGNDLRIAQGPLSERAIDDYALILEALYRISPDMAILVSEQYGTDWKCSQSNASLHQLVEDFNEVKGITLGEYSLIEGSQRASNLLNLAHVVTQNLAITDDMVAEDQIHFNEEAYSLFAETLLDKMDGLDIRL